MICQTILELPTDMGYFSYLPPELLPEIADLLTLSDMNTFYQTGKKLPSVIPTALFSKTQKHLEQLESKLFEITDLRIHSNPMNNSYYSNFKKQSHEDTKINSKERCEALRECICRIFWDMTLSEILRITDIFPTEDPLLLSKIIKSHSKFVQSLRIEKNNDKNLALFLRMLGANQLRVKVLNLCIDHLDDTTVTLFANAIRKNKSLTDVHFEYPLSYPKYLKEPIEAIKENEQIVCAKFKTIGEKVWDTIKNKKSYIKVL